MDMSNSTNDGAKAVLCSWKFRGDVMEMRLMAVWSASADPLDSQGEVLTGTTIWGSVLLPTTLSSEPERWTQCLTRSMSASLFLVTGIARILFITAQNSTSCSWNNILSSLQKSSAIQKKYCTEGVSKWEAGKRAIAIFQLYFLPTHLQAAPELTLLKNVPNPLVPFSLHTDHSTL